MRQAEIVQHNFLTGVVWEPECSCLRGCAIAGRDRGTGSTSINPNHSPCSHREGENGLGES